MLDKTRILYVSHATKLGGAERSLLELVTELGQSGRIATFMAAPDGAVSSAARDAAAVVMPVCFPELAFSRTCRRPVGTLTGLVRASRQLAAHIARSGAEIVHANGQMALIPALWAARTTQTPLVWHVREYPERLFVLRQAGRMISAAVTPSVFLRDVLRGTLGISKERIHHIPNGVRGFGGANLSREEGRQEFSLQSDAFVVAMAAQLVAWKRHDTLLAAAAQLRSEGMPVEVLLAGADISGKNGRYQRCIQEWMAHPHLARHARMLGHRDDVNAVLAASDVVVLPSMHEPFGRVIIEAWRCGRPVVVADNGAPAEIVCDGATGLHFKTGDANSLAAALKRLWRDPELRNRLAHAGWREARRYSCNRHAEAIMSLYEKVLR
jgi:L-malate glycosyltransferase